MRVWRKGNPLALLVGMQTGAATLENSMEVPQKINSRTTLRSSNRTTGYLSKEYKNTNLEGYMCSYVYCSIIYNSQTMEATQASINKRIDKDDVLCVCVCVCLCVCVCVCVCIDR